MDFNSGTVLDGVSLADSAADLFDRVIATASGAATRSEARGVVRWRSSLRLKHPARSPDV
jgi:altronate dehydratase